MKNKWNKILLELSYRVSTGIPDLSNEQHLMKLWDILKEHNWNLDARVELLKNLDEAVKKRYYQTDKGQSAPKGAKVGVGPDGGTYYWANPDNSPADEKDIPEEEPQDEPQEEPEAETQDDENTPEQNRQKDIELVETQLFMFDGDPQEKGGAGTPESRTGECVTTYAGRRIKELMPPNGKCPTQMRENKLDKSY